MKICNLKNKLPTKCISGLLALAIGGVPSFAVKPMAPMVSPSKQPIGYAEYANNYLRYGAKLGLIIPVYFAIRNGATDLNGALCIAAESGYYDIVKLLLLCHANPNAVGGQRNEPALINAARSSNTEIVKLLLDNGARIDERSDEGMTALMCAITVNKLDMVELLLQRNANKNLIDNYGRNAWAFAEMAISFSHDPHYASAWRNPQDVAGAVLIRNLLLL